MACAIISNRGAKLLCGRGILQAFFGYQQFSAGYWVRVNFFIILNILHLFTSKPQKTIEFDLDIYDSDADSDQQIARFQQKLPITKTGEIELRLGVDVR